MKKYKKTQLSQEVTFICSECGEEEPQCNNCHDYPAKLYCKEVNDHLCPECYNKLIKEKRRK